MKNKILVIIAVTFFSYNYTKAQNISGVYVQNEMENIKMYISENLFLLKDNAKYESLSPFNCKDTLAFGYWEWDDSRMFIKLYTNPIQYASLVNINVVENVGKDNDSIYLYIKNPIENNYIFNKSERKNNDKVYYKINIETDETYTVYDVNMKSYNNDVIVFKAPKSGIKSIEINIHPNNYSSGWRPNMPPHIVTTLPYIVQNHKANIFDINIPELTECYLCTYRLNGDFVKVVNKDQLEWNGHLYTKEE
jgi:hypothetical protein